MAHCDRADFLPTSFAQLSIGGCWLERGKFQKSSSRIYGAHTMVFQAQISNFIEFGPEMAQRNGAEVCSTRVINENQSCPGKVMA